MKSILRKIRKAIVPLALLVVRVIFRLMLGDESFAQYVKKRVSPPIDVSPINVPFAPPPNIIPDKLIGDFTLNREIPVLYFYLDSRVLDNQAVVRNTRKKYKETFKQLDERSFSYYGNDMQAFYDVMINYPFRDKTVLVWGLAGCNCEAMAVWNNAEKVYVVDYNKPICDHEKIEVLSHDELESKQIRTDFAFSYSSFEHDGLGRYGDPINPFGDIKAMSDAHRFLKQDGVLFLGVPLGKDCLCWNAHRIYGKHRLPLLLKGWQCLDVFDVNVIYTKNYPFDLPLGTHIQNLLALRKTDKDFPDNDILNVNTDEEKTTDRGKTCRLDVLKRINEIILNTKKYT
ncbi:hypothetical protein AGMMS50276_30550 [Synergistales bacterium]|nr:hypothetical protein AGMMS50276_30550 [Synergistales bacterium]